MDFGVYLSRNSNGYGESLHLRANQLPESVQKLLFFRRLGGPLSAQVPNLTVGIFYKLYCLYDIKVILFLVELFLV